MGPTWKSSQQKNASPGPTCHTPPSTQYFPVALSLSHTQTLGWLAMEEKEDRVASAEWLRRSSPGQLAAEAEIAIAVGGGG